MSEIKCTCGCGGPAEYMVTTYNFDPDSPDPQGKGEFIRVPCCRTAKQHIMMATGELNFPAICRPVHEGVAYGSRKRFNSTWRTRK